MALHACYPAGPVTLNIAGPWRSVLAVAWTGPLLVCLLLLQPGMFRRLDNPARLGYFGALLVRGLLMLLALLTGRGVPVCWLATCWHSSP